MGEVQKLIQGLGVAHAGAVQLLHQAQALAGVGPALELGRIHLVVVPGGRAAGLDDNGDVLGQLHLHHLAQIRGGKAAAALQIAAAQVPVHRPAFIALRAAGGGAGPFGGGWTVSSRIFPAAGGQGQGHGQGQE